MNSERKYKFYFLLILIIPFTFLMWHGNNIINKKAVNGYSVFSFTNSQQEISLQDSSAAEIKIENLEERELTYKVTFSTNEQEPIVVTKKIKAGSSTTLKPPSVLLKNLLPNQKNELLIKIDWDKNKRSLRKQIYSN